MLTQILANTPKWVFVLFFALLYLGYVQSRTRSISVTRIAAVPIVLGVFSLYGVYSAFGKHSFAIVSWGAGIGLAFLLGGILKQPRGVTHNAADHMYLVPGSWAPLALIMTMFFTRYVVTVMITRDPAVADDAFFAAAISVFYGLLSGTFFARALHMLGAGR